MNRGDRSDDPERADVWVLVDGAGNPCLKWVQHGEPTRSEKRRTELKDDVYGPYKWHRYALVPIRTKAVDAGNFCAALYFSADNYCAR